MALTDLPPGGDAFARVPPIGPPTRAQSDALSHPDGPGTIFVGGIVWYEDAFHRPHETRFCLRLDWITEPDNEGRPVMRRMWVKTQPHNDAD